MERGGKRWQAKRDAALAVFHPSSYCVRRLRFEPKRRRAALAEKRQAQSKSFARPALLSSAPGSCTAAVLSAAFRSAIHGCLITRVVFEFRISLGTRISDFEKVGLSERVRVRNQASDSRIALCPGGSPGFGSQVPPGLRSCNAPIPLNVVLRVVCG